ncbi:class I adenylate cyclase [Solidesulfovibrio magneticus]|nr:class I adenylate cyclase [Solidesulfovibrio magneticus]
MSRPGSPARAIMRTLRTGLSQPPGSDLGALLPLARQALAFIDRGGVDDPATAAEASEVAFLLAALLDAGDENFARQAFPLLFRLGVEGEVLAVTHLETLPEELAVSLLSGLRDEEKLLFANAFFRRPRADRPKTAALCLEVLEDVVERIPDELLILLDLLANRHEYPALPLRNALIRGRLGMWLARLLQMDLSAEQIRYMARVSGRLREPGLVEKLAARLGDLDEVSAEIICRALAETPGLDPAVVSAPARALVDTPEASLTAAALCALARCDEGQAAQSLAALAAAAPGRVAELAPCLAGLSHAAYNQAVRALPPQGRRAMVCAVYAVLAAALPGPVQAAARGLAKAGATDQVLVDVLAADLAARARAAARPLPGRAPLPGPATAAGQSGKGLWSRVKTLVAQPSGTSGEPADNLRRELATPGARLEKRQIMWTALDGAVLADVEVARCSLKAVSLMGAAMTGTVFSASQFADVNFEGARLENVTFDGCRFLNCRFSEAVLRKVRFIDCDMRLCAFGGLAGEDVAMTGLDALACDFIGATLTGLTLTRCRLRAVSLVRAVVHDCACQGAVFSDCLFEMAAFVRIRFVSVRTEGCYFAKSRFIGPTDEPDILGAVARDEASAILEAAEAGQTLPSALADGPGLRLIAAVCDIVLAGRDYRRRRLAMLANNKRRLAWARRRLGEDGAAFLEMLPALVQAPLVRDDNGLRPAPAARIAGQVPNLATARLTAAHFGDRATEAATLPDDAIRIEAVYTIGSVGTVAQTDDSDLDVWVVLAEADATRPDLPAFQDKLDAVSRQADRDHNLEIHFFLMSVSDIRDNIFGYSADEGYGSAQGCLLKEEFYRTALVVAGKKPAWWCLPPDIAEEGYAKAMAALGRTAADVAADCLDFGCVRAIAGDEYFGASLWMIVKSLTSPFKSIIKFGLLEKYAAHPGRPSLLCETLKASILANQGGLWRCDPYALLFKEVSRHYEESGQAGAMELLRQAFLQKTGFDPCDEYASRTGEAILDHFFPYAPPATGSCPPLPKKAGAEAETGFAQGMVLCDAISNYFLKAYERLKNRSAELGAAGGLTERDQAMLSRRIAASFAKRVGKVMRLPFLRPGRHLFDSLEIGLEDGKGREAGLVVRGEPAVRGGARKSRQKETLRQELSVVRLAAWLVANELYRPGLHVQATLLPAPLTLPDCVGLLSAVHDLFPARATFNPPLSWGLSPEKVTAALLVVNMTAPREERATVSIDTLYATSWGEFFHLERTTGLESLGISPRDYLIDSMGLTLDPDARIKVFAPAKSLCQAVRRAKRG